MAKLFDPFQAKDAENEENNDNGAEAQSNTSEDINTDADSSEVICTKSMTWLLIIVMLQWSCTEKTCLDINDTYDVEKAVLQLNNLEPCSSDPSSLFSLWTA